MLRKFMGMSSITSVRRSVKRMVLTQGTEVKKSRLGFAKLLRRPGAIGSEGTVEYCFSPVGVGGRSLAGCFPPVLPTELQGSAGAGRSKGAVGVGARC